MPSGGLAEKEATDAHAFADGASHRLSAQGNLVGSSEMLKAPLLLVRVESVQSNSNTDQATRLSISTSRHLFHVCWSAGTSKLLSPW